jgi:hypothetical protein
MNRRGWESERETDGLREGGENFFKEDLERERTRNYEDFVPKITFIPLMRESTILPFALNVFNPTLILNSCLTDIT